MTRLHYIGADFLGVGLLISIQLGYKTIWDMFKGAEDLRLIASIRTALLISIKACLRISGFDISILITYGSFIDV